MPKVPEFNFPKSYNNDNSYYKSPNDIYWRNKKPIQSEPTKHKPFFTCSKCGYEGKDRKDFNDHWLVEHD